MPRASVDAAAERRNPVARADADGLAGRRREATMAVKLNQRAFRHAKKLIDDGKVTHDERDDWSEHAPSADQENTFLDKH
ncbi:MAG: hypothetical protein ABWY57_09610, partial [Mycetocola sp.]